MTADDSLLFAKALGENFTQATPSDARQCWEFCRQFDVATATTAIERHRLEFGAKVYRPDPRQLAAICRGLLAAPVESPFAARTAQYLAAQAKADAAATADARHAAQAVSAMTDAELAEVTANILAAQSPFVRQKLAAKDPRVSPWWAGLIATHLQDAPLAAAGAGR